MDRVFKKDLGRDINKRKCFCLPYTTTESSNEPCFTSSEGGKENKVVKVAFGLIHNYLSGLAFR